MIQDDIENLKDEKVSFDFKKLSLDTILELLLLIPIFGLAFFLVGISMHYLRSKKHALYKTNLAARDYFLKGLYSGIIVISIMLSLLVYLGFDIFKIQIDEIHIFIAIPFLLLFANAFYATIMVYKALVLLQKEDSVDILASAAWLHAIFLVLIPFGVGLVVFYVYFIILLLALFKLKFLN